jgi:hypothetical protein
MANQKHDIIKLVMLDIYKKRINDLLNTIHNNYPQSFKKEQIKPELDNILDNIILNIGKLPTKKIVPSVSSEATNIKSDIKNVEEKKAAKSIMKVDISERCKARVWNSIFDRKTGKEVADIDDCYKVTDFNDIDNEKFHKKYIIGSRCSRKQKTDLNYCTMHSKHTPHGEFDKLPNKEICFHFIKDGNY